jgi:hypothetical protein
MTKPIPPELRKPHPRALTVPLDQQPEPVRRNRAKQRAMARLRARQPTLYWKLYREELAKVGL